MSGGGTTFQTTTLPSSVENMMNSAAQRIGGLQGILDIGAFAPKHPQSIAQTNWWQQYAADEQGKWAAAAPNQTYGAEWLANNVPTTVGQTPGTFYSATANRPGASEQSLNYLPWLYSAGAEVSPYFNIRPPTESQRASGWAENMYGQGQAGLQAFNPAQQYASQVPADFYNLLALSQGVNLAPTGAGLANSPSLTAAQQAFNTAILPTIENQAAVSGLGRSTALTNAIAQAQAQYMLPIVQDELNREFQGNLQRYGALQNIGLQGAGAAERGIERGSNVSLQQAMATQQLPQIMGSASSLLTQLGQDSAARQLELAQAEERGSVRRMEAFNTAIATLQSQGQQDLARQLELATANERALGRYGESAVPSMQTLLNLAQAETARREAQVGRTAEYGNLAQQIEQAGYDATQNDFLRRQALAEQAIFGPLGQILPSAFGSKVQQPGGLFK